MSDEPEPRAAATCSVPTYDKAPLLVIWEVTRACDLACVHCRAEAQPNRDPGELSFQEGTALLDQIAGMGTRLVVFTGGDPAKRPDLVDLVSEAKARRLIPSISPSATPLMTTKLLHALARAGAGAVSFSLDGSNRRIHDTFRGVPGTFERTLPLAAEVVRTGMELRINTTVTRRNLGDLPALADLVEELGTRVWSVFFLVPTGRGSNRDQISPEECERTLRWLYELSGRVPFRIKTTEAPHYRRVVLEGEARRRGTTVADLLRRGGSMGGRFAPGLNDGRGFCFISHRGEVHPSGFLPLAAGSVRRRPLAEIYRESPLFRSLREPSSFRGLCGCCDFAEICGGSRARAYAVSFDPLADDPLCANVAARRA